MGSTYRYRSAWHAAKALLREHGMRGLFKGYWLTNSVRARLRRGCTNRRGGLRVADSHLRTCVA